MPGRWLFVVTLRKEINRFKLKNYYNTPVDATRTAILAVGDSVNEDPFLSACVTLYMDTLTKHQLGHIEVTVL